MLSQYVCMYLEHNKIDMLHLTVLLVLEITSISLFDY